MVVIVEVACPVCGETQTVVVGPTAVRPMCGTRLRAPASTARPPNTGKHRKPGEVHGIFHDVVVPLLLSAAYLFFAFVIGYCAVLSL